MPYHPFWSRFENSQFSDKYLLRELLGVGAFGAVFRADEVMASQVVRSVAIKLFDPMQSLPIDQIIQELRIAMACKHACLVDCYSSESGKLMQTLDAFGLVMELAGKSLDRRLAKGPLSVAEAIGAIENLAQALTYLHDRRIVHRDLKPANVLLVGEQWKLGDLGIGRALGDRTSASTNLSNQVGTLAYMPPESFDGKIAPAWDIWSLGVMMLELLTGTLPFSGQTFQEMFGQILHANPHIPSSLPANYQAIVRGCLVKDYQQRWTAQQVVAALAGEAEGNAGSSVLVTPGPSLPAAFSPQPSQPAAPLSGFVETLAKGVILEMLAIPGGKFLMGSSVGKVEHLDFEGPQHQVTVPAFYLSKYSITQAQWEAVMQTNPSYFKGNDLPIENVSWHEAKEFCQRLREKLDKLYRLPSEAEWEYACRAGTTTGFYFGDTLTEQMANFGRNVGQSTPVGQYPANGFGLYDMHGNVWEWCEDTWHATYQNAPANGSAWVDGSSTYKCLRGGSWFNYVRYCRSACRYWDDQHLRYFFVGFRLACSLARTS